MKQSGRPKSRFSFQQGAYGSVAPPSQTGPFGRAAIAPTDSVSKNNFSQPVKVRDYFEDDDDDDEDESGSSFPTHKVDASEDVDDYDPLDAFM